MRSRGWGPHDGIRALVRGAPERWSLALSTTWGQQEAGRVQTRRSRDFRDCAPCRSCGLKASGAEEGRAQPLNTGTLLSQAWGAVRKGPGGPYKAHVALRGHTPLPVPGTRSGYSTEHGIWGPFASVYHRVCVTGTGASENLCSPAQNTEARLRARAERARGQRA